ncbi:MAG: hypothetical protein ABJT05_03325, partial [Paracoccaceae bacterium]
MQPLPHISDPTISADVFGDLPVEHVDLPEQLPELARAALARTLPDVRRKLSPRGLDTWLRSTDALV